LKGQGQSSVQGQSCHTEFFKL